MGSKKNLTSIRIGRLLVLTQAESRRGKSGSSKIFWVCQCDCGKQVEIAAMALNCRKPTQSCGCLQLEVVTQQGYNNYKGKGVSVLHSAYSKYKWRASKKNIQFDLSEQDFNDLILGDCYYCDAVPSSLHRAELNIENTLVNGIDRIDNTLGYVYGNVVSCCGVCNTAKSDNSLGDFLSMISRIYNKHIGSKTNE